MSVELGGKSPFIVCADADLDAAAQTVAMQYLNAGQVCLAGTRLLVQAAIADAFLAKVKQAAAAMAVGDPREASTRVGPLITSEHFERVKGFVDRALRDGSIALLGGQPHACGGQYFAADASRERPPGLRNRPARGLWARPHVADVRRRR